MWDNSNAMRRLSSWMILLVVLMLLGAGAVWVMNSPYFPIKQVKIDGKITRSAKIRLVRDGIVITEDEIDSLRRFKDDVKEVATGYECGIGLVKFADIKEGDIFEAFIMEEYRD